MTQPLKVNLLNDLQDDQLLRFLAFIDQRKQNQPTRKFYTWLAGMVEVEQKRRAGETVPLVEFKLAEWSDPDIGEAMADTWQLVYVPTDTEFGDLFDGLHKLFSQVAYLLLTRRPATA